MEEEPRPELPARTSQCSRGSEMEVYEEFQQRCAFYSPEMRDIEDEGQPNTHLCQCEVSEGLDCRHETCDCYSSAYPCGEQCCPECRLQSRNLISLASRDSNIYTNSSLLDEEIDPDTDCFKFSFVIPEVIE
jgi:hypothetical protein